jgi:hypothetical protein
MGFLDTIKVALFGTERVNSAKSECKTKKKSAEDKYKEEMARIEKECVDSLEKAKQLDTQVVATAPVVTQQPQVIPQETKPQQYESELVSDKKEDNPVYGGKKGGKSKKKSKSNRKKTMRKRK